MTFAFGIIGELNSNISLYCFLLVVAFVVFFDYLSGILEYFLEGSKLYNQMIQMIYKELMLMGLVSFSIVMFDTSDSAHKPDAHDWIVGIDFAHILLFFLTFFFVAHAFYIMRQSVICSVLYLKNYCEDISLLIKTIQLVQGSFFSRFLFQLKFLPLSAVRDKAEFLLIHSLFQQTYLLPKDFNFPLYLNGCFDRHALKTINRSVLTWFILIVLVIANYVRIALGYSCDIIEEAAAAGGGHRFLSGGETVIHEDASSHDTYTSQGNYSSHGEYTEHGNFTHSGEDDHHTSAVDYAHANHQCNLRNLILFVIMGGLLCLYTIVLVNISRLYKIRMINRIGTKNTDDYVEYLQKREEDETDSQAERLSYEELKKEIESEFDENEHEEDEEGFRFLGELLKSAYSGVKEGFQFVTLQTRLTFIAIFYPSKLAVNKEFQGASIFASSSVAPHPVDVEKGHGHFDPHSHGHTAEGASHPPQSLKHRIVSMRNMPISDKTAAHIAAINKKHRDVHHSIAPEPLDFSFENEMNRDGDSTKGEGDSREPSPTETKHTPLTLDVPNFDSDHRRVSIASVIHSPRATEELLEHEAAVEKTRWWHHLPCCKSKSQGGGSAMLPRDDFSDIYILNEPLYYFRAVELCIMFNCLYMALWATNFIYIAESMDLSFSWSIGSQFLMCVPIVIVMPSIAFISETCSLLSAVSHLNYEVIYEVIEERAEMNRIVEEFREKVIGKLNEAARAEGFGMMTQRKLIHQVFMEIDADGSGKIDRLEFRTLLRKMKLTYSDHRFKLLFRAIDGGGGGDGNISEQELNDFLFPPSAEDLESGRRTKRDSLHAEKGQDEASVMTRLLSKGRSKGPTDMTEEEDGTVVVDEMHQAASQETAETKMPSGVEVDGEGDTLGDLVQKTHSETAAANTQSRDMRAESIDSTDLNRMV